MIEKKFKTIFSCILRPLVSKEKDKLLALASLERLKEFLPSINLEKNWDLLPVAANACVVNRVNKNDDLIDTATAINILGSFLHKPLNLNHNRTKTIGCILTTGYSAFGSDKPLKEEDIKDSKEPFNIVLGGVIWKMVNKELADIIEDSADPSSAKYLSISASWELAFSEYDIVKIKGGSKNLIDGEVVKEEEFEEVSKKLVANGGVGKIDEDTRVYRKPKNDVVPVGIGLTETPAADVKGIIVMTKNDEDEDSEEDDGEDEEDSGEDKADNVDDKENNGEDENEEGEKEEIQGKEHILTNSIENTSQFKQNNVKNNSIAMKITSLKDITDEALKEIKASHITEFIAEQLEKSSQEYFKKQQDAENSAKAAQEELNKTKEELKKNTEDLTQVKTELEKIKTIEAERKNQEIFDSRMAGFDNDYDLTEEDRKVISAQIKGLNEEAFNSYREQFAVLMREKNKGIIAKKQEEAKASTTVEKKEVKNEAEEKAVAEAVKNADKTETKTIPNSQTPQESYIEKYRPAFSLENVCIK